MVSNKLLILFKLFEDTNLGAELASKDDNQKNSASVVRTVEEHPDGHNKLKSSRTFPCSRSSSASTLPAQSDTPRSSPRSSPQDTPGSSPLDVFWKELGKYANEPAENLMPAPSSGPTSTSIIPHPVSDNEYDSERTDFLLDRPTPCPRREARTRPRTNAQRRRPLQRADTNRRSDPVRRTLDFGGVRKLQSSKKKSQRSETQMLEYSPPHSKSRCKYNSISYS